MEMLFRKLGLIFDKQAQLPTLEDRNENIRIYYSYRIKKQSHINYFEIFKKNLKVNYINKKPVLSPGSLGCFDDVGVMPSCITGGKLYYTGWNLRGTVPYGQSIGCAYFDENKNKFERISKGPILDRSENVPYLANSPFVYKNKMWFCNGTGWDDKFAKYNIWEAQKIKNNWVIKKYLFGKKNEACSRVCFSNIGFLFSRKNKKTKYEIFIREKETEKIKKIISKSQSEDWDSEMTCYPYFFNNMIFYNGNGYGYSGIGVATLE